MYVIIILALLATIVLLYIFTRPSKPDDHKPGFPPKPSYRNPAPVSTVPPEKVIGRKGELVVTDKIRTILRDDDLLFTNVPITYQDKVTELDNVIVNRNGVFIIEIKAYHGRLEGTEDEYEWIKYHDSSAGIRYQKTVKNPIKQVNRQVYILAKYLDYYGTRVWVEGYAVILGAEPPFETDRIFTRTSQIDKVIHTPGKQHLSKTDIETIANLLKP